MASKVDQTKNDHVQIFLIPRNILIQDRTIWAQNLPDNRECLLFLTGRAFIQTRFTYVILIVQTLCANPVLTISTHHFKPRTQAYHTVKSKKKIRYFHRRRPK